jgi:hypothetical protein
MGGTDAPENLVLLTVEEHAQAHKELYEKYGKIEDLWASQLLTNQIGYEEGFSLLLKKNAKDTHRKQKERGTGIANSSMQSAKGKISAAKVGLGKNNNANYVRLCCVGCGKETTLPTFKGYHEKKCF